MGSSPIRPVPLWLILVYLAGAFGLAAVFAWCTAREPASSFPYGALVMFSPLISAAVVHGIARLSRVPLPPLRWKVRDWGAATRWLALFVLLGAMLSAWTLASNPAALATGAELEQAMKTRIAFDLGLESTALEVGALFAIELSLGALLSVPFLLGEEVGWRGFLFPALRTHLGEAASHVVAGVVWGLWHAPMIVWLGLNYPGTPALGVPMMVAFCLPLGFLLQRAYVRSASLLVPALAHGMVNKTVALVFTLFVIEDKLDHLWRGPAGLGAAVMLAVVAGTVARRRR